VNISQIVARETFNAGSISKVEVLKDGVYVIVPSVSSIAKLTVAVLPSVSTVVVDAWVMVVTSSTASTVNLILLCYVRYLW
jgi:hypothetical protein